ncbi:MAG: phosphoserine phosphatase [Candidatus Tokpelaia sp. JSC085]|nr:MAG: phosphoserine phosphatase [Candidatus Tokpelaia sp. JSC085]
MLNNLSFPNIYPFVATLIANPTRSVLTPELADTALRAVNASAVYWLNNGVACDIPLREHVHMKTAYRLLRSALNSMPLDIVVQPMENRRKKLLLADMDSTMIKQECINELAEEANLHQHVAYITDRAMNGEISFETALKERVLLLKNLSLSLIDTIIERRITMMPGAHTLVQTMRTNAAYTALVSGGFTLFAQKIAAIIGFDEYSANILEHNGTNLTGVVREPILGKKAKLDKLLELCTKLCISPTATMAVGDGANDLAMLQHAGAGVAFHAKPIVAAASSMRIDHGDLTALLYIQGYKKTDFSI